MQRESFGEEPCAIARTVDIIGDRWTPLVLRDVALGVTRFDAIQRDLGLSRKVLTQRLQHLLDHEVVTRTPYQDNPVRYDYTLTEKGLDLAMVLVAIQSFGDRWMFGPEESPLRWRHLGCGEISGAVLACEHCGEQVRPGDAVPLRGPGFDERRSPELGAAIDRFADLYDGLPAK
ncbi:MAG: helix-turn-helix transcriptional regulator [Nocardioidaceae bacterium]|nr:helix-turn-helix transcriptional regulator [Nocardioidaceae bacterium]